MKTAKIQKAFPCDAQPKDIKDVCSRESQGVYSAAEITYTSSSIGVFRYEKTLY